MFFWQPAASIVMMVSSMSISAINSGIAVISFDFSSVATWDRLKNNFGFWWNMLV